MNELERELREVLAEQVAAAERPVALLPGARRRARRKLRERIGAAVLAGVVVLAAVAVPVALSSASNSGGQVVGTLTGGHHDPPRGWVPLAFGNVQIWVPPAWVVESQGGCPRQGSAGAVFGGQVPGKGCPLPASVVRLTYDLSAPGNVNPYRTPNPRKEHPIKDVTINGIVVQRLPAAPGALSIDAFTLSMRLTASGPLASRVLGTLTASPLWVAVSGGPKSALPTGFRWHEFGGIKFAAPAGWAVRHRPTWGSCPASVLANTVLLGSAQTSPGSACAPQPDTARSYLGRDGVVVGAGPLTPSPPDHLQCGRVLRMHRFCGELPAPFGTVMTLFLLPPGQPKPTVLYIGLAGTGSTAQEIYDSIRPAPGH